MSKTGGGGPKSRNPTFPAPDTEEKPPALIERISTRRLGHFSGFRAESWRAADAQRRERVKRGSKDPLRRCSRMSESCILRNARPSNATGACDLREAALWRARTPRHTKLWTLTRIAERLESEKWSARSPAQWPKL